MKILVRLLLVISSFLTIAKADDKIPPPENLRAEWTELEELKFSDWGIKSFLGWGIPFDGGSKVFFFESDGGERFDLMVANLQSQGISRIVRRLGARGRNLKRLRLDDRP